MAFSEDKIKLYQIEDILFSDIQQTPTTLAGYGITDGLSIALADSRYVSYVTVQTLTDEQKQRARDNIGAAGGVSHPSVTIGVPNGLSIDISSQILSLALATTIDAGAMSADDKIKLDGIAINANNYVHPSQGIIDTGTLSGKQVISRVTSNVLGHVTAVDIRSDLPYIDFASDETVTGLKTIRRAATNDGSDIRKMFGFEIGDDVFYKLWVANSINEINPDGEVNFFFRTSEIYTNLGDEKAVEHDRIGFFKGGMNIVGGRVPSGAIATDIETWINNNYVAALPYPISMYVYRNMMVEGRGYFGKSNLTDTLFLGADDMLYSEGTVYAKKGLRTADPNNKLTIFDHTTWYLGNAVADATGSHTHKIRVDIDGTLYDIQAQAV